MCQSQYMTLSLAQSTCLSRPLWMSPCRTHCSSPWGWGVWSPHPFCLPLFVWNSLEVGGSYVGLSKGPCSNKSSNEQGALRSQGNQTLQARSVFSGLSVNLCICNMGTQSHCCQRQTVIHSRLLLSLWIPGGFFSFYNFYRWLNIIPVGVIQGHTAKTYTREEESREKVISLKVTYNTMGVMEAVSSSNNWWGTQWLDPHY